MDALLKMTLCCNAQLNRSSGFVGMAMFATADNSIPHATFEVYYEVRQPSDGYHCFTTDGNTWLMLTDSYALGALSSFSRQHWSRRRNVARDAHKGPSLPVLMENWSYGSSSQW